MCYLFVFMCNYLFCCAAVDVVVWINGIRMLEELLLSIYFCFTLFVWSYGFIMEIIIK